MQKKEFRVTGHTWLKVPDDFVLLDPDIWKTKSKKLFGAVRKVYLVVWSESVFTKKGPSILERTLPKDAEVKFEKKVSLVTKKTDIISGSVQRTISSKLSSEITTKLSSELGLLPVISGKLTAELQSKISAEFTDALTTQLAGTQSYEVTNLQEFTSSVSVKMPDNQSPLHKYHLFLPVRSRRWDIYLFRQEALEFRYATKWLFWNERQDERYSLEEVRLPLARINFFEPQDDFPSLAVDPYDPDVSDAAEVSVELLTDSYPTYAYPDTKTLQDLAAVAFPENDKEKEVGRAVRAKLPAKRSKKDRLVEELVAGTIRQVSAKGDRKISAPAGNRRTRPTRQKVSVGISSKKAGRGGKVSRASKR